VGERNRVVRERIRVVALSPAASRFVVALGAGHLIVGVDAESRRLPELAELPVVALADAGRVSPDLVLVHEVPDDDDPVALELRSAGVEVVEFAPHDLEDVFALCRSVGGRLVGTASALRFETDLGRPLAQIGGSSFGRLRPRVLAVVGFDPLVLAGGHSFETDLIEIAGGRSLTHGGDEARLAVDAEQLAAFAPDLVLVVTPGEASAAEQRLARDALASDYRVEFLAVDTELFRLRDPVEPARRLRALIEPLSRELEARREAAVR
jgi:iron complex transport system substrate-binding protein